MKLTRLLPLAALVLLAGSVSAQTADAQPAAAKTLAAQTTCPIGGNAIDKQYFADYEGQRVYFCCPKCIKGFKEFPDKHLYAMFAAGVRPENTQTTCVVSGEKLESKEHYVETLNKRIYTCCGQCAKKVAKDTAKYLDKLEGRKAQTHCPVMGGEIDKEVSTVVQGQRVYYCCPGCDGKMKKDADKYFASLAAKKVVTESAHSVCPVMKAEAVDQAISVVYQGRRVRFCCDGCVKRFVADPGKYLARL